MKKAERQPYLDNGIYRDSLFDRLMENPPYRPLLRVIPEKEELIGPVLAKAKGELAREGIDSKKKARQFEDILFRFAGASCGRLIPELLNDPKVYLTEKQLSGDVLINAMVLAGEDMSQELFLLVAPEQTPVIRKDPYFTPAVLSKNTKPNGIGKLHNCTVLVCEYIQPESCGQFRSFLCARNLLEASAFLTVQQERTSVEVTWEIDIARLEGGCCINILSSI